MAFTAPYYTVGKQRAQWHRNKAESHFAKAGSYGLAAGVAGYPGSRKALASQYNTPEEFFKMGTVVSGTASVGHLGVGAYHAGKANRIKKDLRTRSNHV